MSILKKIKFILLYQALARNNIINCTRPKFVDCWLLFTAEIVSDTLGYSGFHRPSHNNIPSYHTPRLAITDIFCIIAYWYTCILILPHSGSILDSQLSWESFSLQDGATKWYYNHLLSQPTNQPPVNLLCSFNVVRCPHPICPRTLCGVPTLAWNLTR